MRYFVSISFRGANYCGWQIQKNGPSVEAEVERALSIHLREKIDVVGAGRTDAGVNAINFIAHFDSLSPNLVGDSESFLYKTNAILPPDIIVTDIFAVADNAHARFDATSRTYKYFVHLRKDPFGTEFSYYCKHNLDVGKMNDAAKLLLGTKDFSCFEKLHSDSATSVCTITEAVWSFRHPEHTSDPDGIFLTFTITANRFLRNMVRAIVGSLIEIGRGKREPEWINVILESEDRCSAGQSVPGNALFLTDIKYPYELKNNKIKITDYVSNNLTS